MTIKELLEALLSRWRVWVSFALLGLLAGVALFLLTPYAYTAKSTLYVAATTNDSPNNAYYGFQLSQQRITSYVEIADSPRVTRQVTQDLSLPTSPDDLAGKIQASAATQSVLITIAGTDSDPANAVRITNSAANVFSNVVNELERPPGGSGIQPVNIRVVEPAIDAPRTSRGSKTSAAYGLIAGLAVGIAVSLVRHSLDTKLRSTGDLVKLSRVPHIGDIVLDTRTNRDRPVLEEAPSSPDGEAYRRVRTNLQYLDVDESVNVFTITSPRDGDGKSTTVANLALASAFAGAHVLVIEADLRRPMVASLLDAHSDVGLSAVLAGRASLETAVQVSERSRIHVLPSGSLPPNPSELLASRQMANLIASVKLRYDYVFVDTPPVLPVTDAAAAAASTDGVLLVCALNRDTSHEVAQALDSLSSARAQILGTILTMVPKKGLARGSYDSYYANPSGSTLARPSGELDARTETTFVPSPSLAANPSDRGGGSAPSPWRRR